MSDRREGQEVLERVEALAHAYDELVEHHKEHHRLHGVQTVLAEGIVTADMANRLKRAMELLKEAREYILGEWGYDCPLEQKIRAFLEEASDDK
jgi:hypothetical protein